MDLNEAKYRELREKLREIIIALETSKGESPEVLADLKKQHEEIKRELAKFKTELKENGGKNK